MRGMSSNPQAPAARPSTRSEIKRAAAGLAAIAAGCFIYTTVNDPVARIMSFGFVALGLAALTDAAKATWSARRH